MATKSILNNVTIRDRGLGKSLVSALENAEKKSCQHTQLSRKCAEIKTDDILRMFK